MGQNKGISEIKIWRHKQASRNKAKPMKTGKYVCLYDVGNLNCYIITGSSYELKWQP